MRFFPMGPQERQLELRGFGVLRPRWLGLQTWLTMGTMGGYNTIHIGLINQQTFHWGHLVDQELVLGSLPS